MDPLKFKTDMAFAYGEPSPMGPGIVRLVAPNPSPLTFKGTNTYLVGSTSLAVIDAGPDAKSIARRSSRAAGARPITHIISTHAHRDHVDGVAKLKAESGAVIAAYPRDPAAGTIALEHSPSGSYFVDYDFAPDLPAQGRRHDRGCRLGADGDPHAWTRAGSSLLRTRRPPASFSPAIT